ncbi:hypothetical protein [Aeoliella sp. SH292]|uniref:hypothetical protein n=1 Tax=Aeoliella sp. SH292 TaxID=3454464 RepID=UPI003F98A56E
MGKPIDLLLSLRPYDGLRDAQVCLALAKKYFEIETSWAEKLRMLDFFPPINIAQALAPDIGSPDMAVLLRSNFATSTAEHRACEGFLLWQALTDSTPHLISQHRLEDPYPVLLDFFKHGGRLAMEGWQAEVFGCGGFDVRQLRKQMLGFG